MKSGNDFILLQGDGEASEAFDAVAALRTTSMTMNGATVDVTTKDSNSWQALLPGGGLKSLSISAEGVLPEEADDSDDTVKNFRARLMDGSINNYQLDDDENTVECGFQVTNFEHGGDVNAEQTFSITLESSGEPTVAASA